MTTSSGHQTYAWTTMACVSAVGLALIYLTYRQVLPWQGVADPRDESLGPPELAELGLSSVKYVQGLSTAVFGGSLLLLSQRLLGGAQLGSDRLRRLFTALGFLMLSLSLLVGFINIELVTEAARQRLLTDKTDALRLMRILQSFYLLAGVLMIGGVLVSDTVGGQGVVRKE